MDREQAAARPNTSLLTAQLASMLSVKYVRGTQLLGRQACGLDSLRTRLAKLGVGFIIIFNIYFDRHERKKREVFLETESEENEAMQFRLSDVYLVLRFEFDGVFCIGLGWKG